MGFTVTAKRALQKAKILRWIGRLSAESLTALDIWQTSLCFSIIAIVAHTGPAGVLTCRCNGRSHTPNVTG